MVELKIEWTEKNLKEYCMFNLFGKTKRILALVIMLIAIFLVLVTGCIVLYFAFDFYQGLILAGMLTVFWAAGALFLRSVVNGTIKKAIEENKNRLDQSVIVGEHSILICHSGTPVGEVKWDQITEVYFNDKAETVYLNTGNDAVLMLEKKNIVSGTMEELKKIAKEKRRETAK